jgi:multidrug resistance efflux pump
MTQSQNDKPQVGKTHTRGDRINRRVRVVYLLAVAIALGVTIKPKFTHIASVDSVINTDLITLKNDIPGIVSFADGIEPGAPISKEMTLYDISNARYGSAESATAHASLRNQLSGVIAERKSLQLALIQRQQEYERALALMSKNYVAKAQVEQIKHELDRIENLIKIKQQHENETREDLADVSAQLAMFKQEVGRSPCDGVVWSIIARSHEFREGTSPLLKLIDKNAVWIDAYFLEKEARYLVSKSPVSIEVVGSGMRLRGTIEFLRAGIGRIDFDSPVQIPPESFKRRVVVARISIASPNPFTASEFYGVGRSVRVLLER